ncbi:hypothetical protein KL905_005317 [Ogataea polymorpha]|nr:hypothetical protein KL937_005327 [Ogataea polymorpha]KAG7885316.1 hypothetical protein KL936_005380 [Ogataea polymorpha]KAG7887722.1 hypothetical protein KL908_005373 [Ogataea polymorpha]KAG7897264.1 hypothetical protein KL935_005335 [Ogataea polymorpha]KAG7898166.1 hypothetical protein KL907_005362 [Ogataea polymorpha]
MYAPVLRPAVLFFFFIRQPVAAGALVGTWALWEADRNLNWGIKDAINEWKHRFLGFPTQRSIYSDFSKLDAQMRRS